MCEELGPIVRELQLLLLLLHFVAHYDTQMDTGNLFSEGFVIIILVYRLNSTIPPEKRRQNLSERCGQHTDAQVERRHPSSFKRQ